MDIQVETRPARQPYDILVVDDEEGLREVYSEALQSRGYRVRAATDGEAALAMLQSHTPDLILSDIRMPRLGGEQMLETMQGMGLSLPVIFLTGYGTVESAVRCLKLGAADYLRKPLDLLRLFAKIEEVLARKSETKPAPRGMEDIETFARALREQKDRKGIYKTLLTRVKRSLAPDAMALFTCDSREGVLDPPILWGQAFRDNAPAAPGLKEMAHLAIRQGLGVSLVGLSQAEALCRETGLGSLLRAPITGTQGMHGALILGRRIRGPAFTAGEQRRLDLFVGQAAPFVEMFLTRRRSSNLNAEVITSYALTVEAKDLYTRGHSERVSAYAMLLGHTLGLGEADIRLLRIAGILHDMGKIGIPDSILNKPSALNSEELKIVKRHPVVGREILSKVSSLQDVVPLVYHHHEHYNGRGYPTGASGEAIPYLARVLSVVDGFEALTSDRSYHKAITADQAMQVLAHGAGTQWDPTVAEAWTDVARNKSLTSLLESGLAIGGAIRRDERVAVVR